MIGQMDGLILQLGTVIGGDEERLAQLVAIVRGLVQVLKAAATLDGQSLIGTRKLFPSGAGFHRSAAR